MLRALEQRASRCGPRQVTEKRTVRPSRERRDRRKQSRSKASTSFLAPVASRTSQCVEHAVSPRTASASPSTTDAHEHQRRLAIAIASATRARRSSPVASTQGSLVDTILGEDAAMNYDVTPNVVYTHPEIAQVGLTEAQAKEKYGADVKAARFNFRGSGRALALGEADGLTKIVTAGKDQRIVGVHLVGPQASELIAEATLALRLEATVDDVIATIHAHPTLAETFREAALSAAGRPINAAR